MLSLALLAVASAASANIKGLSQIVTPDIQPFGWMAMVYQEQDARLGNPYQLQYDLGITPRFELAAFQGLRPGQANISAQYGLVQKKYFLVSTGFTNGGGSGGASPFLEAEWIKGKGALIAGVQRIQGAYYPVLGASWQLTPKITLMTDYIGGSSNYTTVGATYNLNNNLSVTSAMYVSNDSSHHMMPFVMATWNVKLWK